MSRDAEVAALAEALRQAEVDILTLHPAGTPLSHAPLFLADRLEANGWTLAPAASDPPERTEARRVAAAILDRRSADPDDDLAILARQFVRCDDRLAAPPDPPT